LGLAARVGGAGLGVAGLEVSAGGAGLDPAGLEKSEGATGLDPAGLAASEGGGPNEAGGAIRGAVGLAASVDGTAGPGRAAPAVGSFHPSSSSGSRLTRNVDPATSRARCGGDNYPAGAPLHRPAETS
jgi:hypothetical protein